MSAQPKAVTTICSGVLPAPTMMTLKSGAFVRFKVKKEHRHTSCFSKFTLEFNEILKYMKTFCSLPLFLVPFIIYFYWQHNNWKIFPVNKDLSKFLPKVGFKCHIFKQIDPTSQPSCHVYSHFLLPLYSQLITVTNSGRRTRSSKHVISSTCTPFWPGARHSQPARLRVEICSASPAWQNTGTSEVGTWAEGMRS